MLKARAPRPPLDGTFEWHLDPTATHHLPHHLVWFLDGSMVDDLAPGVLGACGFSIVVVSIDGELVGLGSGVPPAWVADSAMAEGWALQVALSWQPGGSRIVTDCRSLLDSLSLSTVARTGARASLARIWRMIRATLDDDWAQLRDGLIWMPSHTTELRMGSHPPKDSRGREVSWLQWRANRLADRLAKSAARRASIPARLAQEVKEWRGLHLHQAALLGTVTFNANACRLQPGEPLARDSSGQRPARGRRRGAAAAERPPTHPSTPPTTE